MNSKVYFNNYMVCDITIPDHSQELYKTEITIKKYQKIVKNLFHQNYITDIQHDNIYEHVIAILNYIGELSTEIFNIQKDLEYFYLKTYKHSPELAKKLWLEHYDSINHPYDLLKNRCFKILDNIDELYISAHKKYPPNWYNCNLF